MYFDIIMLNIFFHSSLTYLSLSVPVIIAVFCSIQLREWAVHFMSLLHPIVSALLFSIGGFIQIGIGGPERVIADTIGTLSSLSYQVIGSLLFMIIIFKNRKSIERKSVLLLISVIVYIWITLVFLRPIYSFWMNLFSV